MYSQLGFANLTANHRRILSEHIASINLQKLFLNFLYSERLQLSSLKLKMSDLVSSLTGLVRRTKHHLINRIGEIAELLWYNIGWLVIPYNYQQVNWLCFTIHYSGKIARKVSLSTLPSSMYRMHLIVCRFIWVLAPQIPILLIVFYGEQGIHRLSC